MDGDEDNSDELAEIERQKLIADFEAKAGEKWTPETEREEFHAIAKPDRLADMSRRDIIARRRFDRLEGRYAPPLEDTLPRFMQGAGLPKAAAPRSAARKKRKPTANLKQALVRALVEMATERHDIHSATVKTLRPEATRRAGLGAGRGDSDSTWNRALAQARSSVGPDLSDKT